MKKHSSHSLCTFALAVFITSPVFAGAAASGVANLTGDFLRDQALENRDAWAAYRRDFSEAMSICLERRTQGEDITCPKIDDRAGVRKLLKGGTPQHSASATGSMVLRYEDLSDGTKSLLRRYQRVNSCPSSLKEGWLPGLYELCLKMIRTGTHRKANPLGTVNPKAALHRHVTKPRPATLNERLEQLTKPARPDR